MFFLTIATMFLAIPMFAQATSAPATGGSTPWGPIGAGLAMAIASGLCALGQGRATAGAAEAMARNPAAVPAIRTALFVGLALIESLALYTLLIVLKAG
jgi:F-type H+-transporting ATPase subunit c